MPKWLNKATANIFAWSLYWTQGMLLPVGSIVSLLLVVVLLIISIYYVYVANTRYKLPVFFVGLNVLLALFTVYGIFLILSGEQAGTLSSFDYLKKIYLSLLPIYSFYVFSKEKMLTEGMMCWIIIFLFGVVTIMFFQDYQRQLLEAMLRHSSAEEFTNNIGYYFLALIPTCVYLYKKPLLQYVALGYCVVFMIMGMKRGALFIGMICLVWFIWNNLNKANLKMKLGIAALSMVLCVFGYMFIQYQMENSLYFQKRIEDTIEGNSSGRDNLYMFFADYFWNKTSPPQFLFGSGANATIKISPHYAHNDWLEIAINQGVFGIVIYLFYWICFARTVVFGKYAYHERLSLQLLFVIFLFETFFSMSYGSMPINAAFVLGYSLAQEEKNEQVVYSN